MMPQDSKSSTDRPTADLAVFLPNYNHARFLSGSLGAILGQTLQPKGIWIVDDASTDDSAAVLSEYQRQHPDLIHLTLLTKNRGYIANLQDWLETVETEYIYLCAADDVCLPPLFEDSIALLERHPKAPFSSAMSRLMNAEGKDLGSFPTARVLDEPGFLAPADVARHLMRGDSWVMGNVAMHRSKYFREVGFDRALGSFADGLLYRVLALRHGACFLPRELGYWRRMEGGEAARTATSPDEVLRIVDEATARMNGPFKDLFPDGYGRRWQGRWIFWSLISCLLLPRPVAREKISAILKTVPLATRCLLMAALRSPVAYRQLTKLLGFVLLRPWDVPHALARLIGGGAAARQ